MDILGEIAYDYTPYRYGFNNPVFWQDRTGLFETYRDAFKFLESNKLKGKIYLLNEKDSSQGFVVTVIGGEFDGQSFYDFHSPLESSKKKGGGGYGDNNVSESSANSESSGFIDKANWMAGTIGTAFEFTPGSFRLGNGAYNGNVFSPKYYPSGWTGGSIARIRTYNIAKIGKGLG